MEGSSAQLYVSADEVAVQASKASVYVGRGNIGVWNSESMYKPLADTYHNFWSNKGVILPAHTTAVDIVKGGVQVPVFRGTAKQIPAYAPSTYLASPSVTVQGSAFLQGGNQSSFGPPLNAVGEMGPHDRMGHILRSSQALCSKSDVQVSESCRRRFMMFNRCGNKRRMIFHPGMMNKILDSSPSSLLKAGVSNLDPLPDKAFSRRDTGMVAPSFLASTPPVDPSFPNNSQLLLGKTFVDLHSSSSDNNAPILSTRENAVAKSEKNDDGNPEISVYSHENTEDLEALLSSDEDEASSTGHSPGDITKNNSPLNNRSNNEGHMCISKKRKNRTENHVDNEETCSTATSGIKMCNKLSKQNCNASDGNESFVVSHKATLGEGLGRGNEELTAFDRWFSDEASSSSSASNQKQDNKSMSMPHQQQDGQSRKEKIKSILRLLRGIIPGGESMNAAYVLDEAIQYVKNLQIEVQKLQARKSLREL